MNRIFKFLYREVVGFIGHLSNALFVDLTFYFKSRQGAKNDTAQSITGIILHKALSISFFDQFC